MEEGVLHEELRRSQLRSKMLRKVSHDILIKFMSKSQLTSKIKEILNLYFG